MRDSILVVNAGSSSIKFQLFSVGGDDQPERRMKGQMDGIGSRPRLVARGADGKPLVDRAWRAEEVSGVPAALDKVVEFLREVSSSRLPSAVGHRVVHGGPDYSTPIAIDQDVLRPPRAARRRSRRCISPTTSRRSGCCSTGSRVCCRSPASTPPSTAAIPRLPTATRSPRGSTEKACAATDSTGCRTSTLPIVCRKVAPDLASRQGDRCPSR